MEKETLTAIISAVQLEYEKREMLKKEILEAIESQDKRKGEPWHKHPVFLLTLGFVLTSILGGFIAYLTKKSEITFQRTILIEETRLREKLSLIEDVSTNLTTMTTSLTGVKDVYFTYVDTSALGESQRQKKIFDFENAFQLWEKQRYVIPPKLKFNYSDSTVTKIENQFDTINDIYNSAKLQDSTINILSKNLFKYKKNDLLVKKIDIELLCTKLMRHRNNIRESTKIIMQILYQDLGKELSQKGT